MIKINTIETCFNAHEETLLATKKLFPVIRQMAEICQDAMITGHKILICGNGGSAADAQHIAAEFIEGFITSGGRFLQLPLVQIHLS